MFFSTRSFCTLMVTIILSNSIIVTQAGHARFHKHQSKSHAHLHRRTSNFDHSHAVVSNKAILSRDTNSTDITDASQILSDTTAFASWIDVWANSTNISNSASSMSQVEDAVKEYEEKVQNWLQVNKASSASSTIQQIQGYFTTFSQWMDNWLVQANSTDSDSAKTSLQTDVREYTSWMSTLISTSNSSSAPDPAAPSVSIPLVSSLALPLQSSFADAQVYFTTTQAATTTTSIATAFVTSTITQVSTLILSSSSLSASASNSDGGQFVQHSSSGIPSVPSSAPSTTLIISSSASPTTSVAASSSVSLSGPSQGSTFNPRAKDNVAVYFGQTAATAQIPLPKLCSDASIDIVLLAFLDDYYGASNTPGSAPSTNFGPFSPEQLAPQITACQQQGKVVLLSLGGAKEYSHSIFTDDAAAITFAHTLWDNFGGGTADSDSRPFGSVKFDGFDLDNESGSQVGYQAFTSTLQSLYKTDSSKKYYLTAAPQCPTPDASIPLSSMQNMDFVWVQFFNNGNCNIGQSGFSQSFQTWSKQLQGGSGQGPMFMVGAPASPPSAGSGYVEPAAMQQALDQVKSAGLSNFGGVMLWDGSQAIGNDNYQQMIKQALQ